MQVLAASDGGSGGGPPPALVQLSAALAALNASAASFSYATMQQYAMSTAVMDRGAESNGRGAA